MAGAGVATLGVLRALQAGGWNVHLVLNVRRTDAAKVEAARGLCTRLTAVPRPRMRILPLGGWLGTLGRYGYAPRWQPEMWRATDAALREGGVDLVILDHIRAAEYGRLAKEAGHRVPIGLREHNVEHVLNARLAPEMERRWERVETRLRAARYKAIETHLARYCDVVLPISEIDAAKLAEANPGFPSIALPSPVDTERYRPAASPAPGKEIVFVGGMGYGPNRDAVTWFVKEVFPAIRARHPDARFTAVGEKPPEWFAEHAGVEGPGFVPDERVYVERGRVFVAPIRYGSGVRTKILNALAMRRPVVATTIGAEGLKLERGREILIEDDPLAFAEAVSGVLGDDHRAAALADEGLRAVLATYAPGAVALRIREALAVASEHARKAAGTP
jgi:glycosyltransferase involved in cell wall biosynthesis